MADMVYRIFPKDSFLRCTDKEIESAVKMIELYTDGKVSFANYGDITFIDCGGNFESVNCPHCNGLLEIGLWQDMMDKAYENTNGNFFDLNIMMPCCNTLSALNELSYHMPCGFATFVIEVWNPTDSPCAVELHEMGKCFGSCYFFRMIAAKI